MQPTSLNFKENASRALKDPQLQRALSNVKTGFIAKRAEARAALPEFDELRAVAVEIKNHVLDHLDIYLEDYERKVIASGGHVHWARDAAEARQIVLKLCRDAGAKSVTKGKSMVSEEIGLNAALEAEGIETVETDLGEYIIQIRHESPSHIIAPAVHLNRDQIETDFRALHKSLPDGRDLAQASDLVGEARIMLREKFLAADVGITGANFLIAETGSSVIVTNEGNGDLTQLLPRMHIVIASIEKIVPTLEDASTILRLLARSATGQEITTYTTFSTGPRREGRSGRPASLSRRPLGQRPLGNARHRVSGHAALHPLRGMPEPLPRLRRCRRPCLWLGLPRPNGSRSHTSAHRHPRGRAPAQRFKLLRTLPGGLPDEHPLAENDAALARARLSSAVCNLAPETCFAGVGFPGQAAGTLPDRRGFAWPRSVAVCWKQAALLQASAGTRMD